MRFETTNDGFEGKDRRGKALRNLAILKIFNSRCKQIAVRRPLFRNPAEVGASDWRLFVSAEWFGSRRLEDHDVDALEKKMIPIATCIGSKAS